MCCPYRYSSHVETDHSHARANGATCIEPHVPEQKEQYFYGRNSNFRCSFEEVNKERQEPQIARRIWGQSNMGLGRYWKETVRRQYIMLKSLFQSGQVQPWLPAFSFNQYCPGVPKYPPSSYVGRLVSFRFFFTLQRKLNLSFSSLNACSNWTAAQEIWTVWYVIYPN